MTLRTNRLGLGVALLVAALPVLHARAASAQDRPEPDPNSLGTHQKNIRLEAGTRVQLIGNEGLDAFSENDVVPQLALSASWGFFAADALSLAAVGGFDYGGTSSRARNNATSLDLSRFTLGPEARYHLFRTLALSAKVAPTLTREAAEVSTGIDSDLRSVAWKLGVDATAGAALELYGYRSGTSRKPRLWVTAEGGYGWTTAHDMILRPTEASEAPQRLMPLELEDLSVSGPLFRMTIALSFR
ncbi:MAG TPA: hypothetical protein VJN18_24025 [Polyangiaceae bacterium]|nr:hypothetical protein [Polyangiaceae bacterium]